MIIQAMSGLGDNIYLRPVIKWLPRRKEINIITPWPQIYVDLPNVKCLRPVFSGLRTQSDNINREDLKWKGPAERPDYFLTYEIQKEPPLYTFLRMICGQQPTWLDNTFTIPDGWIDSAYRLIPANKPVCLIRPNTIRSEWPCPARNPRNEYLQQFINMYRKKYYFVSLANLCIGKEWYEKPLVNIDIEMLNCSLEITVGLFAIANLIVCSPSFWMPLGATLNSKMLVIYGAGEQHKQIHDKRLETKNMVVVEPDPFERCSVRKPDAYKDIPKDILVRAFEEVTCK